MNVTVELGDRKLVVAPANLKSIKRWLKAQKEVPVGTFEYMEEVSIFIHAALVIEQSDLDRDWLEEKLNERNIPDVIAKIYEAGKLESGEQERPQNP